MKDDPLTRRLQREAIQGRVRLLKERLRTGTLAPERLRLACALGDPAAREAAGDAAPEEPDLERWLIGLGEFGPDALVRACFAAVRWVLPNYERACPGDRRPRRALDAADAWVACPCPRHAQAASAASREAEAAALSLGERLRRAGTPEPADEGAAAVAEAVAVVAEVCAGEPASYVRYAGVVAEAVLAWGEPGHPASEVRAAIRGALVPWALGR